MLRVLITGASGQLGRALRKTFPRHWQLQCPGRSRLDIADDAALSAAVSAWVPDVVVNAAAFTNVDGAEDDRAGAMAANAVGPGLLGRLGRRHGFRVVHISTDYVFGGRQAIPYGSEQEADPVNVYGHSKAEGEKQLRDAAQDGAAIVRTSWLYAPWGRNFVDTMLRLCAQRDRIEVVFDQVGTPTSVYTVATAVQRLVESPQLSGTFHCTDAGVASWYDFAEAIYDQGKTLGLIRRDVSVRPVTREEYPTRAERPAYSVLDCRETWRRLDMEPGHWRTSLRRILEERAVG